jgi:DNA polymerase, archaea type
MHSLLFGHNNEARIVALHPVGGSSIRIYKRIDGRIESADVEFFPFFHLSDSRFIDGFPKKFWLKKLEGANYYQYLCAFQSSFDAWEAVQYALRKISTHNQTPITSYLDTEQILFRPDMTTQFLLQSGMTLFKEMEFSDLYRMQIDIETYSKTHRLSNAERGDDAVIMIALSDNRGWEKVLGSKRTGEAKLLTELIAVLKDKDPDIIEGHHCYNHVLPYLLKRCELLGIEFNVGRDGSAPSSYSTRTAFAETTVEYTSYEIAGRHIIDTWLLLQSYDASRRTMEHYSLNYAAQYFGIAARGNTYIPEDKISWHWEHDPAALHLHAAEKARVTRALGDTLLGTSFYLAQMLPFNFGTLAKLGSAAKIESIFLREYLRRRYSLPKPQRGAQTSGGYTDVFATGVFGPIVHADVESLYPSLMLTRGIRPATDALEVFTTALRFLTTKRLEAKRELKTLTDPAARFHTDALQSSLKILINSFYGYLGYSKALFNDYARADEVTSSGQELLRRLIRDITLNNGTVIEVDTDGLYFIPPDNVTGERAEQEFVARLSALLPEGITLGFSGRYKKMLSYKKKNYALLDHHDKVAMKGSSLLSRSIEKFGRIFLQQCIECLLDGRFDELHRLYIELTHSLRFHEMNAADFTRTDTIKESLEEYEDGVKNGRRNRAAVYEAVIQSKRPVRVGERVTYYFTGKDAAIVGFKNVKEASLWDENFPDENVGFYLKRLDELADKFRVFFSEKDFQQIFTSDDLFGFDAAEILVVNRRADTPAETGAGHVPIELDDSQ